MPVVDSKKLRIFWSDVESEKQRELERRRKLRIQQVRQQSKDLANIIRKKVRSEKENEKTRFKKAERIALQQYHESKLKRLEELYRCCLEDIGDSHIQAAREPNAELILKAKQAQNAAEAQVRGEEAKRRQEEILLEQKIQKEAPIKQKKSARTKEDLRSALIVRIPHTRDKVKNEIISVQSGVCKPSSAETTKSALDEKSDQQKIQILQEIPSNIRLQTEDSSTENTTIQDTDTNKASKNIRKSYKKDIRASSPIISANRYSNGECENKTKCPCTYSCNHHTDNDEHSKRKSENKVSSDRGYRSDSDYESAVRRPHHRCNNKQYPCYCRIKYYDHCNHFQSQYKRLNPVTPHHDTDAVSSEGDLLDEKAISEKNKKLEENMQKAQARGKEAIRRQLAKQKFQKLLKELSTLDREERIARCKALISNVNMGESLRRAALDAKQQKMNMAFEKIYTTAHSRSVTNDDRNVDFDRVSHSPGRSFVNNSPPATLNVADWKTFAAVNASSKTFHPFHEYNKHHHHHAYQFSPSVPQYSSLPVHQAVVPPVVNHSSHSAAPLPSPPPSHPPDSHKLPTSSLSVSQNNEDEDSLNALFQRIEHHRKVLLGESVRRQGSNNEKENPNKRVTLAFSKQFVYSVSPEESKHKVIDDDNDGGSGGGDDDDDDDDDNNNNEVKLSEVSNSFNRRRKLSKGRSRPETRKKKLPKTKERCDQWSKVSNRPSSPSKVAIQIPTKNHSKVNTDVGPMPKSVENDHIVKKINNVDVEAIQGDNELPLFDGVEVTIRVREKDRKKSPKKIKQRHLLGRENLGMTKPIKYTKITDSSTSYYSPPDRITPSQQNLIDAIMSRVQKRGLSSRLKLHIQNLLSMSRENISDLGISSSDISIDSVSIEPVITKQVTTKDNMAQLQNEAQCTIKTAMKSEDLNPGKKDLKIETAQKTADIISQYSQLSEMLVKKIEKLAKMGNCFNESFKPDIVNETSAVNLDVDTSRNPASTADSSYLYLPPEINSNLPVGRNIIEVFSSGNRYSQLTRTFNELPEPLYVGHTFFAPFQTEMISKETSDAQGLSIPYFPNNPTRSAEDVNILTNNNSSIYQPEVQAQNKEIDRKSKPPPTLSNGRFRFGMESASPPHELTTIPEVDTPGTHCYSNSNVLSEQEEETYINVFEGLNISQCESDIGSASIKSFDSVSSVPDIDTVLMKRNVITSPFENRRKRKVMRVLQNKQSQQQLCTGSSNIKSSNQEHLQMNTSSEGNNDVSVMTWNLSDDNHVDLENISMSPVQYIGHSLESKNNVNPFTEHNEVISLEKSFNPDVISVSVDNIKCKEVIEVDNAKQQVSYANDQAGSISKTTFKNNDCPFPKEDKCIESRVRKLPFESHIGFSDFVDERLAKFNEILKDLDEAKEIMSDSTPEDLELAFHRLGVGWAGTTLRKTQEAQELNSGSTSDTNEGIGRPAKLEAREKNASLNWKKVEEDLTPPNLSLRAPILLSTSTTNLESIKPENILIKTHFIR